MRQGEETVGVTATAARIAEDAEAARMNARLHRFEKLIASSSAQVLAMAHRMLTRYSTVERKIVTLIPDPMTGEVSDQESYQLDDNAGQGFPWDQTRQLVADGAEIIHLGVDAMIGAELASGWIDQEPLEIIRRSVMVTVEHGSTQRRVRMERLDQFQQLYKEMIAPLAMAVGDYGSMLAAASKALSMADLSEFESVLPKLPEPTAPAGAGGPAEAAAPDTAPVVVQ